MGDGVLKLTVKEHLVAGAVLREVSRVDGNVPQFGDSVIVEITHPSQFNTYNETQVKLARPHMIVDTTGGWYIHVEEYKVEASRLVSDTSLYRTVCLASGKPTNVQR